MYGESLKRYNSPSLFSNEVLLAGRDVLQNEPNLKSVWYCIGELLSVFGDSAQHEHTIGSVIKSSKKPSYKKRVLIHWL